MVLTGGYEWLGVVRGGYGWLRNGNWLLRGVKNGNGW